MALQTGSPTFFHSDQGRQYAAKAHVALLQAGNTIITMSDAGCPTQNGLVERFIRRIVQKPRTVQKGGSRVSQSGKARISTRKTTTLRKSCWNWQLLVFHFDYSGC
jgi:transposase InsO family protein